MNCCSHIGTIGGRSIHDLMLPRSLIEFPESSAFISVRYWIQWPICMFSRPEVRYYCDVNYDPFVYMEENNKIYGLYTLSTSVGDWTKHLGFTITLIEWEPTIKTLWATVKGISGHTSRWRVPTSVHFTEFMALHPEHIQKDNSMAFLSDNGGDSYNLCHCKVF